MSLFWSPIGSCLRQVVWIKRTRKLLRTCPLCSLALSVLFFPSYPCQNQKGTTAPSEQNGFPFGHKLSSSYSQFKVLSSVRQARVVSFLHFLVTVRFGRWFYFTVCVFDLFLRWCWTVGWRKSVWLLLFDNTGSTFSTKRGVCFFCFLRDHKMEAF